MKTSEVVKMKLYRDVIMSASEHIEHVDTVVFYELIASSMGVSTGVIKETLLEIGVANDKKGFMSIDVLRLYKLMKATMTKELLY